MPNGSPAPPRPTLGRLRSTRLFAVSVALAVFGLSGFVAWVLQAQLARPDRSPPQRVDLAEPDAPPLNLRSAPDSSYLVMAVAPVISPEQTVTKYNALVRYLAEKTGRKPLLLQRPSYSETNDLLRGGGCDIAFVCTYAFVAGERSFGMQLLAVPVIQGADTYQSYLVVPAASPAKNLLDLRGKRFVSADPLSWSGWVYAATSLIATGVNPHEIFAEHGFVGSHDRSIRAVALGLVDGASVDSLVYTEMVNRDPELERQVQVIQRSPRFGMPPLVVHPRIDPALRGSLLEALINMAQSHEGREVLAHLGIDRFVIPDTRTYDVVRRGAELWEEHR